VAVLAALGIMVACNREASANLTLNAGIVQTGGSGHNTDPPYTYEFDVVLNGTIPVGVYPFTSVTVDNLYGINPGNYATYIDDANGGPPNGAGWVGLITSVTPVPSPTTEPGGYSDVTWTFFNLTGSPISGTAVDLGILTVTTSYGGYAGDDYSPFPSTVYYSYQLNGGPSEGGTSGSNTIPLEDGGITPNVSLVPEPSTLLAPLVVLLGLPLCRLIQRRGRRG
jgi:hypothetical protein